MESYNTKIIRPNFSKPSKPDIEILTASAPKKAWEIAIKDSQRSPMGAYGTGAVIIDKSGEVVSNGCAHPSPDGTMQTTHAERHCLQRAYNTDLRDCVCLVYTSSARSGGSPWSSRPCLNCARALVKRGVRAAFYPVRDRESGLWRVEIDYMKDALSGKCWNKISKSDAIFARSLARV